MASDEKHSSYQVVVYFHSPCSDGLASAWVLWKHYSSCPNAKIRFVPVAPGTQFPLLVERDDIVYFVDICPDEKFLKSVLQKTRAIFIFDHHETNRANIELFSKMNIEILFEPEDHSGCMLTYMFFKGRDDDYEPQKITLLKYIEDRDLWKFYLPDSKEISGFISSYATFPIPLRFGATDTVVEAAQQETIVCLVDFDALLETKPSVMIEKGKMIMETTEVSVGKMIKESSPCILTLPQNGKAGVKKIVVDKEMATYHNQRTIEEFEDHGSTWNQLPEEEKKASECKSVYDYICQNWTDTPKLLKVAVLNSVSSFYVSEVGDKMMETKYVFDPNIGPEYPDIAIVWNSRTGTDDTLKFHLRSNDTYGFDSGFVSYLFGGGGHRNMSAFEVSGLKLTDFITPI